MVLYLKNLAPLSRSFDFHSPRKGINPLQRGEGVGLLSGAVLLSNGE